MASKQESGAKLRDSDNPPLCYRYRGLQKRVGGWEVRRWGNSAARRQGREQKRVCCVGAVNVLRFGPDPDSNLSANILSPLLLGISEGCLSQIVGLPMW